MNSQYGLGLIASARYKNSIIADFISKKVLGLRDLFNNIFKYKFQSVDNLSVNSHINTSCLYTIARFDTIIDHIQKTQFGPKKSKMTQNGHVRRIVKRFLKIRCHDTAVILLIIIESIFRFARLKCKKIRVLFHYPYSSPFSG